MKLFSKKLTPTDCLKRLSIPKRVLTFFPEFHGGHAVELKVRCETIEYWPLFCTIRRQGRHKKPVISKGWRKFVLAKKLNVGDDLTLHKEEDEESGSSHYTVEVKRANMTSRALYVDETTSTRSHKNVEAKRVPVVINCTDRTSEGTDRSTDRKNNTLFEQFGDDLSDVADVNNIQESNKEQKREFKLFGTIIVGGELLIAHHNSVKQFSLSTARAVLVNNNGQDSPRSGGALALGGAVVHGHDQATTSSTSFYRTDQRLGLELDMILGQSIGDHSSVVNLDLTLQP